MGIKHVLLLLLTRLIFRDFDFINKSFDLLLLILCRRVQTS